MENAAIVKAYDLAKTARLHTFKDSLNAAREAHLGAASNYATASNSVHDIEARRVLALLQDYHVQLANSIATLPPAKRSPTAAAADTRSSTLSPPTSSATPISPTSSPYTRRPPYRELTSSIAKNLANARGRPTNNTAAAVKPKSKPPPQQPQPLTSPTKNNELLFKKIYHNFYSNMPPDVAYSSLPLRPDSAESSQRASTVSSPSSTQILAGDMSTSTSSSPTSSRRPSKSHRHNSSTRATIGPDLSTIFSKPALRALRDTHMRGDMTESFYLIQPNDPALTEAAAASAQRKLERQQQRQRRRQQRLKGGNTDIDDIDNETYSSTDDDDDDDDMSDAEFVDAVETFTADNASSSAKDKKNAASNDNRKKNLQAQQTAQVPLSSTGRTLEELELRNTELQNMVVEQARQLEENKKRLKKQLQKPLVTEDATAAAAAAAKQREQQAKRIEDLEKALEVTQTKYAGQKTKLLKFRAYFTEVKERKEKKKQEEEEEEQETKARDAAAATEAAASSPGTTVASSTPTTPRPGSDAAKTK